MLAQCCSCESIAGGTILLTLVLQWPLFAAPTAPSAGGGGVEIYKPTTVLMHTYAHFYILLRAHNVTRYACKFHITRYKIRYLCLVAARQFKNEVAMRTHCVHGTAVL